MPSGPYKALKGLIRSLRPLEGTWGPYKALKSITSGFILLGYGALGAHGSMLGPGPTGRVQRPEKSLEKNTELSFLIQQRVEARAPWHSIRLHKAL